MPISGLVSRSSLVMPTAWRYERAGAREAPSVSSRLTIFRSTRLPAPLSLELLPDWVTCTVPSCGVQSCTRECSLPGFRRGLAEQRRSTRAVSCHPEPRSRRSRLSRRVWEILRFAQDDKRGALRMRRGRRPG